MGLKNAKDKDAFRKKREKYKKAYRERTGSGQYDLHRRYTIEEDRMVLAHEIPDEELGKILKRSVSSIQIRRTRLVKDIASLKDGENDG